MPAGHPGIIQAARNRPARVPARCGFGTTTPRISAAVCVSISLERPLLKALAAPDPSATGERLSRLAGIPAPEANAMGAISHRGVAKRSDRSRAPRTAVRALGVIAALVAFALLPSSADALTSQVLQASASNTPGFADSHMNDGSPSWTWGAFTTAGGLEVRSQKS